jgi:endonuclease/exonuclease/phosphatase family metal-dependent hydrolase
MAEAAAPRRRIGLGWRIVIGIGVVLLLLVAYLAVVVVGNRSQTPVASLEVPAPKTDLPNALPAEITLTTWNIGFAALGVEGDAVSDGGKSLFPQSGELVQHNLDGIVALLGTIDQDVLMLQEVSQHSIMSWWRPVYDTIAATMPARQIAFRPDITTWGLPFPLVIDHGTVVALKANPANVEVIPLPLEPGAIMGLIKRRYAMQVVRVPIEGTAAQWVLVNLHLSPFDEGGVTRKEQLEVLMDFASGEYEKGNHVVLGGDWNMVLADPRLPSTTPQELLFWVVDFPLEMLPAGWSIVTAPEGEATVRTTDKPYVEGENYRTAIDGFVVSPNVTARSVKVTDTKFSFSDHMPVTAVFAAN